LLPAAVPNRNRRSFGRKRPIGDGWKYQRWSRAFIAATDAMLRYTIEVALW